MYVHVHYQSTRDIFRWEIIIRLIVYHISHLSIYCLRNIPIYPNVVSDYLIASQTFYNILYL